MSTLPTDLAPATVRAALTLALTPGFKPAHVPFNRLAPVGFVGTMVDAETMVAADGVVVAHLPVPGAPTREYAVVVDVYGGLHPTYVTGPTARRCVGIVNGSPEYRHATAEDFRGALAVHA